MKCQCCGENVESEEEMIAAKDGKVVYVFCSVDCGQDFANNEGDVEYGES